MKKSKDLISIILGAAGLVILLVLGQMFHVLPFSLPFLPDHSSTGTLPSPLPSPALEEATPPSGTPHERSSSPLPQGESPSGEPSVSPSNSASPLGAPLPGGSPSASPSESLQGGLSAADKQTKANIEIFKEIYEVTLITSVKDLKQIEAWVNTLNQGASLEGVYHGLTKSNEYQTLEKKSPPASPEAIKAFTVEMDELQQELPEKLQMKDSAPTAGSIYLYKRILGEEALRVFEHKYQDREKDREKFGMWYARFAVRLARKKVDFGLELRNKPDQVFHQKWALETLDRKSEEQLKWEILNRLHRVLNEANKVQAEPKGKEP